MSSADAEAHHYTVDDPVDVFRKGNSYDSGIGCNR